MDLWRFVAILLIMAHHQYHVGINDHQFVHAWVFVEFFFILTGYLTTSHFSKMQSSDLDVMSKNALVYTFRKFLPLLPFVCLAVFLEYGMETVVMLLNGAAVREIVLFLSEIPFELLLVNASYKTPQSVPLWYLSAMLIVFPVFCLLLQIKKRNLLLLISGVIPVIFYGAVGIGDNFWFPVNLGRAFSAMLLGTLAFELNQTVFSTVWEKVDRRILTVAQLFCALFPAILSYSKGYVLLRPIVFCFFVGIMITMSQKSHLGNLNSKVTDYLGKLAMPIYMLHWWVGGVIAYVVEMRELVLPDGLKVLLYYAGSILLSVVAYELDRYIKIKRKNRGS